MQRLFDIIISLTFLLVLFPIFLLISLILKYTGEGEILYFQERVGMNGAKFSLIKFATMLKNSPNFGAGNLTLKDDPRVLPFGKFLRKTKINELPQLVNIFIGDMSIVGPRPMVSDTYQHYSSDAQNKLNLIQPGLTGIGSIIFRDEEKFLEKASDPAEFYKKIIIPYKSELESWYVDNKSFNNYIKCIFVTAWVIFFPKSRLIKIAFKDLPIKPDELQ